MVLNKPQDLAVYITIFALLSVLVGIGIQDINRFGVEVNESYFSSVRENALSADGLKGQADNSILTVEGNGTSGQTSESSLLIKGFSGIVNLGQMWGVMWLELLNMSKLIGIPYEYIIFISALLAISFVVVLYTWIRTRN